MFVNSKTGCPRTLEKLRPEWENGVLESKDCDFCILRVCHVDGAKGNVSERGKAFQRVMFEWRLKFLTEPEELLIKV